VYVCACACACACACVCACACACACARARVHERAAHVWHEALMWMMLHTFGGRHVTHINK